MRVFLEDQETGIYLIPVPRQNDETLCLHRLTDHLVVDLVVCTRRYPPQRVRPRTARWAVRRVEQAIDCSASGVYAVLGGVCRPPLHRCCHLPDLHQVVWVQSLLFELAVRVEVVRPDLAVLRTAVGYLAFLVLAHALRQYHRFALAIPILRGSGPFSEYPSQLHHPRRKAPHMAAYFDQSGCPDLGNGRIHAPGDRDYAIFVKSRDL